jgi:hypothetical protein
METEIVDFSDGSETPDEGEAQDKPLVCKMMIIAVSGTTHLVFGPVSEFGYHANLVDRFCSQRDIAAAWVRKPDIVEILEKDVKLGGGGWMKINKPESLIEIYGRSTAYGRFDKEQLKLLVDREPFFSNSRVRIR